MVIPFANFDEAKAGKMNILPHWRGGSSVGVISPNYFDSVVSQDHVIRVASVPLASEHGRKVGVVLLGWENIYF